MPRYLQAPSFNSWHKDPLAGYTNKYIQRINSLTINDKLYKKSFR